MLPILDLLRVTFGPLHYEFHAHDPWGVGVFARLRQYMAITDFEGRPDRVVHIARLDLTPEEIIEINADRMPDRIAALFYSDPVRRKWQLTGDATGSIVWWHSVASDAAWIQTNLLDYSEATFQLPWPLLLADISNRGGGLLHGGLATLHESGFLFLAPAGGGKTTSLSRIPSPWRVWSDDAVLLWPNRAGKFLVSPLPTWSVLLGRNAAIEGIDRWQIGVSAPLASLQFLEKRDRVHLVKLNALDASKLLYRAFCEHPRVLTNRKPLLAHFFHVACAVARTVPAWSLELTLDGEYWTELAKSL